MKSYRRILVPLDGSTRAETALAHVEPIARALGSEIILLHIEQPTYNPSGETTFAPATPPSPGAAAIRPDMTISSTVLAYRYDRARVAAARQYVEDVAARLRGEGISVRVEVETDPDIGERLAAIAHSGEVDLIALTTQAPVGLERLVYGNMVDQVIRTATVPILIVRVPHAAH